MPPVMNSVFYVDVFTATPLRGNPVAVVVDAAGLSSEQMGRFAAWTNLSETTFVTEARGAEYALRIFTPQSEIPFAGHPSLGTAWALLQLGKVTPQSGQLIQRCGVGDVPLTVEGETTYVQIPQLGSTDVSADLAPAFGSLTLSRPRVIDVGPRWIVARVEEGPDALLALCPELGAIVALEQQLEAVGVTLYAIDGERVVVRSFAPGSGIPEDPVCGSGNGAVAIHLEMDGRTPVGRSYTASQGQYLGRDGQIAVRWQGPQLQVGGRCVTVVEGRLAL